MFCVLINLPKSKIYLFWFSIKWIVPNFIRDSFPQMTIFIIFVRPFIHSWTGNCPIYNYKVAQNTRPTYYTCNNFTSGCPSAMFESKEVYKRKFRLQIIYATFLDSTCLEHSLFLIKVKINSWFDLFILSPKFSLN